MDKCIEINTENASIEIYFHFEDSAVVYVKAYYTFYGPSFGTVKTYNAYFDISDSDSLQAIYEFIMSKENDKFVSIYL